MRAFFFYVDFNGEMKDWQRSAIRDLLTKFDNVDFVHVAPAAPGIKPYATFYVFGKRWWAEQMYQHLRWDFEERFDLVIGRFEYIEREFCEWSPPRICHRKKKLPDWVRGKLKAMMDRG